MVGKNSLKTFKLKGNVHNQDLTILVDGDRTHNFIQERVVKFMDLTKTYSSQFQVMVENREQLV